MHGFVIIMIVALALALALAMHKKLNIVIFHIYEHQYHIIKY
jgi:hypothetical protein